jgi:hypothetical protein
MKWHYTSIKILSFWPGHGFRIFFQRFSLMQQHLFDIHHVAMSILFCSCSRIHLRGIKTPVVPLTPEHASSISGVYQGQCDSCQTSEYGLWFFVTHKTAPDNQPVLVEAGHHKKLVFKRPLANGDTAVRIVKGRYRNGFFISRTKWSSNMFIGPLIWAPGTRRLVLGLTSGGKLFVTYNSTAIALIVAMPVSASAGDNEGLFSRVPDR